jgi:DMATS type aromatic prenyltransferase
MASLSVLPSLTLADIGANRLRLLCSALGYGAARTRASVALFQKLAGSWGRRGVDRPPPWASDITDDHSPFELSLAIDGGVPELRFLIEVQGEEPGVASNWEAARAMNERLAASSGVHLGRLTQVEDLFAPTTECHRFAMWHAVCLPPHARPEFKIYLNPQVRGKAGARALVEEAMVRLGFGDACAHLPEPQAREEICYFSLDLSDRPEARVKVYTAHHRATIDRLEAAVAGASGHAQGAVADFCESMAGSLGPFHGRPVLTCLSFVEGRSAPTTGTIHFPVRSYARHDGVVRDRVLQYIHADAAPVYHAGLDAFADRRLEDGVGMQTYVSLRLERGRRRLTVYLAPEVYDVTQSAMTQPAASGVVETSGVLEQGAGGSVVWRVASGDGDG